ncbi:hypothetical protein SAMN05428939_2942 [Streptomyces sp. TLI_105]|nr:hypothetical protein SAMN05428939_2942 [Streptomyces sp. TLI_105]
MPARTLPGMGTVTFVDETTTGGRTAGPRLPVTEERLTLRELIRRRVEHETAHASHEEAFARAVEAFGRNGFLVLVGDRQVEELDETVTVDPETEVVFLRLVPLVGG